jgi:HK97 family phage portal protein
MAARDWLPFLRRKDNPVAQLIVLGLGYSRQPITPKVSFALQSREGYQQNSAVYTCVNLLARGCAGIPWVLYKRGAGGKPQKVMSVRAATKAWQAGTPQARKAVQSSEIADHPLLSLIERPNPLMGGSSYAEFVFASLLINGNSFETWVGPETGANRGRALELWPLRPDRVVIVVAEPSSHQLVGGYQYRVGTTYDTFDPATVLHQKFYSPLDDLYGLSPIQVAARTIDGDNAAAEWNRNLLQNDARPPAALVVKGGMQDDMRERLNDELATSFSGPINARRPLILEGDVDWKLLSVSPADLDWLQGRKLNAREIANVYGVPSEFVDMDSVSYASKEQARKGLYQDRILPLMDQRREDLNNSQIVRAYGDNLFLDYDRDQIEALHEDAQKLYQGLRQADWLSVNEKREATGYDEVDETNDTKPADTPVAFLKPSQLPGAPGDTAAPGEPQTTGASQPGLEPGAKAQDLTDHQRAIERDLHQKLDANFRAQAKAVARLIRQKLG